MTEQCPFVKFEAQPTEQVKGITLLSGITEPIDPPFYVGRSRVSCTECPLAQTVFSVESSKIVAKVNGTLNAKKYAQQNCPRSSSDK